MKRILNWCKRLLTMQGHAPEGGSLAMSLSPIDDPETILTGARILFADDNSDQHFILQESLKPMGIDLTCVRDGVEALEAAQDRAFDLILMDIDMPILNGYEATHALRAKGYTGPILALTGYIFPDELDKCRSAGFTDHLCKPFNSETLYATLARHLRK